MVAGQMTARDAPRQLRVAARSDTGRSRSNNQDFAYAGPLPGAEHWTLLAVADGLGGHARGEWASERAIELLAASLPGYLQTEDPQAALESAIAGANAAINSEALQLGTPGAATTLVAALCREAEWWWCNVGDSRLYFLTKGIFRQVSNDHSWVAEQVRAGLLPPDAADNHPNKNVVTKTVGFEPVVSPDTGGPLEIKLGEALVLCSDGLHGPVSDDEIARAVATLDPGFAAERLIELANAAGGPDNITVVIGKLGGPAPAASEAQLPAASSLTTEQTPLRRWPRRRLGFALAGLVILAGMVAGLVVVQLQS